MKADLPLGKVAELSEVKFMQLHDIGKNARQAIKAVMQEHNLSFVQEKKQR